LTESKEMSMDESTNPEGEKNDSILTVRDVAGYLRISEAKIYRLAKAGRVPSFRCGKSWRFSRDLLDKWIREESQRTPQGAS
jgi:excisionase family DNA binding protein